MELRHGRDVWAGEEVLGDDERGARIFRRHQTVTSAVGTTGAVDGVRKSQVLGGKQFHGLLVHTARLGPTMAPRCRGIVEARDQGLFAKLGISAASDDVLIREAVSPQIMQLPVSVIDQRLVRNGVIHALKELDVEIHVRSILQVCLSQSSELPMWLRHVQPALSTFHRRLKELSVSRSRPGSHFRSISDIDRVIVGMSNYAEAEEIPSSNSQSGRPEELSIGDNVLLDPSWVSTKQARFEASPRHRQSPILAIVQARRFIALR